MNTMKTFLLMGILTVMLVVAGNLLGGQGGMILAFAIAVVMNVGSYWFSDKIVLRMYGAQPVEESAAPGLFRMTREMSERAGIPMPKLFIIPSDQPNAFATGRDPKHGVVAVTSGLLRMMSQEELRGVVAHELAHIKNRDILVGTIAATFAGAISMLANMAQWSMIFGGGRSSDDEGGGSPIGAIAMMIVAPIAALLVQMAISRSREFLADEGGAQFSGNPLYLAQALRKLEARAHEIPMEASPATAHMFIVNPLSGGGLMKLFSTHPPVEDRVSRLESMVYGSAVMSR